MKPPLPFFVALLLVVCLTAGAHGQYGFSSPADMLVARIQAHADLVRAESDAVVSFAQARKINAEAVRTEIANSIEHVKAFWKRRAIRKAELAEKRDYLLQQTKRDQKTWDRLRFHPELVGSSIPSGKALNFIKDRLSAYSLAHAATKTVPQLSSRTRSALRLRQPGSSGGVGGHVFSAATGNALTTTWWPHLLRAEVLLMERKAFEEALAPIVAGKSSGVALQSLENRLLQLGKAFYVANDADAIAATGLEKFRQYRRAEKHLRTLHSEIMRLQTTGDSGGLKNWAGYRPEIDGKDIRSLLAYMLRSGVEFAPAQPGGEHAYYEVFDSLRGLYIKQPPRARPKKTKN